MPQKYKYESILKTFQYSKESYQIISDFLLSGDITNPDIKLKVDKITSIFRLNQKPRDWFRLTTTKSFISALINIKLEAKNKKLEKIILKWAKDENIDKSVFYTEWVESPLDKIYKIELEELTKKDDAKLMRLVKNIGFVSVKKGGKNRNGEALQGTWINRDLAVEYARWLDPKFSIWISQKILELVNDGVSWNEIRKQTKIDYKPLTYAIEKYIKPLHPNMIDKILYGKIANYINLRVKNQKAKEIREELNIEDHKLTRDYFEKLDLERIEKVQIFAEMLISQLKIFDFKTLKEMILKYEFSN
jgi:hypothetical protein